ncbi:MAG: uridylate kinase [Methyloceanibacter sp.]
MARSPLQKAMPAPLSGADRPIVVKLGGSVIRSPELSAWLNAIAALTRQAIVVPGGGALADEVRLCQRDLGFDDASAHRMALLAMDQLAWAVAGMRAGLEVGTTEEALRDALERGRVAVWAPYALLAGRSDIEESWRLTSDSLALWLAGKMQAAACYLVKSIERRHDRLGAAQLALDGVVDAAFPDMLRLTGVAAYLLGRGDQQAFAHARAPTSTEFAGALID